jgi:NADH-quinone oxidoreductase subunit L
MFRLWYLTFLGETRSHDVHAHESPWSMAGPLVILALLSVGGGWIGIERFAAMLAPATGAHALKGGSTQLELVLSVVAVAVALLGWFLADRMYRKNPKSPEKLAEAMPTGYKLLSNKYYVDEIYGAAIVKPLMATSTYVLGWVVDKAVIGGAAWLLGGLATFAGALLQRWQSGNIRSYAAWVAAGAAALLLFVIVPWTSVLANFGIHLNMAGH